MDFGLALADVAALAALAVLPVLSIFPLEGSMSVIIRLNREVEAAGMEDLFRLDDR